MGKGKGKGRLRPVGETAGADSWLTRKKEARELQAESATKVATQNTAPLKVIGARDPAARAS